MIEYVHSCLATFDVQSKVTCEPVLLSQRGLYFCGIDVGGGLGQAGGANGGDDRLVGEEDR
jgi:hypothetical protein